MTDAQAARASILVAEAKVYANDAALTISEKLLELGGSRASLSQHNLDQHWRNARVHTLHDPVRWKIHAIGNYYLNGVFLHVMHGFKESFMTSYQAIASFNSSNSTQAHIIRDDAEALSIATTLSERFKEKSVQRDAERILPFEEIEQFSQFGLWTITVPKRFGGADVSSLTVAKSLHCLVALTARLDRFLIITSMPLRYFVILVPSNKSRSSIKKYCKAHVLAMHLQNLNPEQRLRNIQRLQPPRMVI